MVFLKVEKLTGFIPHPVHDPDIIKQSFIVLSLDDSKARARSRTEFR